MDLKSTRIYNSLIIIISDFTLLSESLAQPCKLSGLLSSSLWADTSLGGRIKDNGTKMHFSHFTWWWLINRHQRPVLATKRELVFKVSYQTCILSYKNHGVYIFNPNSIFTLSS